MGRIRALGLLLLCATGTRAQTFSFKPGAVYPAANGPIAVATGDFNGDGTPDLAIGNVSSNSVSIYIGNGDGSFTAGATVSVPSCFVGYLAAGDFNHDGHTDLVAPCEYQNAIYVLPGLGNGEFGAPISTTVPNLITFYGFGEGYFQNYAAADFNHDGIPDLVIGLTDSSFDLSSFSLDVMLSNGDGTFQSPIVVVSSSESVSIPIGVVTGDFNHDGSEDLAVVTDLMPAAASQLRIFLGNGKGAFQAGQVLNPPSATEVASLVAADVNGDGIPDLLVSLASSASGTKASEIFVYLGAGDGTFSPLNGGQMVSGQGAFGLIAANLHGTATVDLLQAITVGSGSSTTFAIQVSAGNGDGTFQSPVPIVFPPQLEPWPFAMLAGDWNGDGLTDLAFAALPADFQVSEKNAGSGLQTLLNGLASLPAGNLVTILNGLTPAPALAVSKNQFQFTYVSGGAAPASQSVAISNSGTGKLSWTATANSPWLTVSPASGTAPANLTVSISPASLTPATYTGTVSVASAGAVASPQSIAVTLTVSAASNAPVITGVVNGASFQAGIQSGSWVTIQGSNLSNTNPGRIWTSSEIVNGKLPTSLDGTSVTIDGKAAYVYYISPAQLNVQAPTDSTIGMVPVVVTNNGQVSSAFSAQLQTYSPAFFVYSPTSYAIAQHYPDYALVGNPNAIPGTIAAHPGDVLILWATGFGPTSPATPAGIVVTGAPAVTMLPTVTVGGVTVSVVGTPVLSPDSAGLYQVAIQLPASVPTGVVPIQASVAGVTSPATVMLYVSAQ